MEPMLTIACRVVAWGLTGRGLPTFRCRRSEALGRRICPPELLRKGNVHSMRMTDGPLRVAIVRSKWLSR
jgi:hypothetical protein